jgi:hypothetical protein
MNKQITTEELARLLKDLIAKRELDLEAEEVAYLEIQIERSLGLR